MGRRDQFGRGGRRSQGGLGDANLTALLGLLASITNAVWFDPAWEPGVVTQDDGGTLRVTSVQSRPIHTQYTVSQGTLAVAPAAGTSPNGKRILSFAGAHYLSGAAALAALLQGSASYSTVGLASVVVGSTRGRLGFSRTAASPDDRVVHYISSAGNVAGAFRVANGVQTPNTGSALTTGPVYTFAETYNGSDYDAWLNGVAETLTSGGANTRAPAVLDDMTWGCQRASGAPASFWSGLQTGLVVCPGTVLTTTDREALQTRLARYYGY